jgi:hypothetical protein
LWEEGIINLIPFLDEDMRKYFNASNLAIILAMFLFLFFFSKSARILLDQSLQALRFKYTLDYGEGPLLDQSVRLSKGENIYSPDITQTPYTIANYPPLFVLLQVPFVWAFGPALWYGRLISLLSTILAALFTGLTIWTLTRDRTAGLAGGLLYVIFPYVLWWSQLNRIDNLALAFMMAGMFVLARNPNSTRSRISAALLMLAAIFTRQSYALAGPLAALVYLLFEPSRPIGYKFDRRYHLKRTFHFFAWLAGTGLILFLVLMIWSGGGFFFHIVTANVNPFNWETVQEYCRDIRFYMSFLLAGSFGMLLWGLSEPRRLINRSVRRNTHLVAEKPARRDRPARGIDHRAWWLAAPFLLGSIGSAITIGKEGSNVNYLLELCAALSLSFGMLIAWAGQESRVFKIALLVVLALQVNIILKWSGETYATFTPGRFQELPQLFQLNQAIQRAETGPLLADEHMAMLVTNGRNLVFQPFEYKMLHEAGIWNQEAFLESIRNQEFPLILLYDPEFWDSQSARWTPEQLETIYEHYRSNGRLANTILLVPNR